MKKLLLTAALLVSTTFLFSQTKFGVKAGVNFANQEFKSEGASFTPSSLTSFHLHGLIDHPLSPTLSLQPALGISGKGFRLDAGGVDADMSFLYLDIPVNVVAKFPVPALGKFFVGAGPYFAYGISAKAKGDIENDEDIFSDEGYKRGDLGLNFLGGVELSQGLLLNVNYGLGLANISNASEEDGDISVKNKVFSISLGFLF
ncbi:porin family protein [Paradesertivirga mongoliensis]|uniref:Porin family protein n=1 Tax=Paradesertivirga mongoliensis TaxID=2100740 RepID=A0ABW4ZKP7_9SPHI|nr:porin family protein [Pedobacter mongoliensis]